MSPRRISSTEERLIEIQSRIGKWNEFVRELKMPCDIAVAVSTGRLELLKLAQPRALTAEECSMLYQLIGGLLETNQALQQHTSLIAQQASEVNRGLGGLLGIAERLEAYANYRQPHDSDEDES